MGSVRNAYLNPTLHAWTPAHYTALSNPLPGTSSALLRLGMFSGIGFDPRSTSPYHGARRFPFGAHGREFEAPEYCRWRVAFPFFFGWIANGPGVKTDPGIVCGHSVRRSQVLRSWVNRCTGSTLVDKARVLMVRSGASSQQVPPPLQNRAPRLPRP